MMAVIKTFILKKKKNHEKDSWLSLGISKERCRQQQGMAFKLRTEASKFVLQLLVGYGWFNVELHLSLLCYQ